jgi:hypothetical protein
MPSSKSQRISSASNKLFAGSGTPRVLVGAENTAADA